MRWIALLPIFALCGFADGQTLTVITLNGTALNGPLVTCTMKDYRRVDKCTVAPGHTLEEAVQAVLDSNSKSQDARDAEIKDADSRLARCIGIAERENKALRRCSDGLNDIANMLRKDSAK